MRAPVGGLFRHVRDLAGEQSAGGHAVGLICDASTGGADARALLAELEPACGLGIARINMGRLPGLSDAVAARAVSAVAREKRVDILHGHGAKGGAYARLHQLQYSEEQALADS
jgi:saccharopine dehydrogenase-like NADP-dependent oxidoreductase